MDKVIPERGDKLEEKFIVTLPDKTEFHIVAQTSDISTMYYFGSLNKYCVICQVYTESSYMAPFVNVKVAFISNVVYSELCCINRKFLKGEDTRNLLKLVFAFIQSRHSYLIGVALDDKSTRTCDNKLDVDLSLLHYLQDGQTWYMSRFGAKMSKEDEINFELADSKFTKENVPWIGIEKYTGKVYPIPEEEIKHIYEISTDMRDFFNKLYSRIGASSFCNFVSKWLSPFMSEYFKFRLKDLRITIYFDNPKVNPPIEFTQKLIERNGVVQSGGHKRKYTRKQHRRTLRGTYL
jgi:hypothetical protein